MNQSGELSVVVRGMQHAKVYAIIKKEADRSVLYECDVLITDRLCEETLIFNGGDVNVLTGREINEISGMTSSTVEKMKKDSIRPKIIRLVNKNTALGELK